MGITYIYGKIRHLWWLPLISGLICIGLGIWTLCSPQTSLPVLAYIFAGCLCAAGLVELIFSFSMSRYNTYWGWSFVLGILDLVAGVWLFCLPVNVLTTAFIFIAGIWLLVVAIESLAEACVMSAVSPAWMFLMILMLFAVIILMSIFLFNPIAGFETVWLWLGISLIMYGCYRLMIAGRLRSII